MSKDNLEHEKHCCNDETQEGCGCGCGCDNKENESNKENKENCGCGCGCDDNEEEYIKEYDEDCGCGCGDNIEFEKIKLILEDGREVTASVIEVIELNDKEYIALLPDGEDNVLLYEFIEKEDAIELVNIKSDEEFESVSQAFFNQIDFDGIKDEE